MAIGLTITSENARRRLERFTRDQLKRKKYAVSRPNCSIKNDIVRRFR